MRNSRRSALDPFIVMDVMEAMRQAEADGRHIIHMEVGQPETPAPARPCIGLSRRPDVEFAVRNSLPASSRVLRSQNRNEAR